LFPGNETLESNGVTPGNRRLNYRFSEMRLTLIQNDDDGGERLWCSRMCPAWCRKWRATQDKTANIYLIEIAL
jgi:hypothetical protein